MQGLSLQQLIDNAKEHDTIKISGFYDESVVIDKSLNLFGVNGAMVGGGIFIISAKVHLKDLTLLGDFDDYILQIAGANCEIAAENIRIDNSGNGILVDESAIDATVRLFKCDILSKNEINGKAVGIMAAGCKAEIVACNLKTSGAKASSTVYVGSGGLENSVELLIKDSIICGDNFNGFCSDSGTVSVTIRDSVIKGLCAICLKPNSLNYIDIFNGQIVGVEKPNGLFSAIVIEGSDNVIRATKNTKIINQFDDNTKNSPIVFIKNANTKNNLIKIRDTELLNTESQTMDINKPKEKTDVAANINLQNATSVVNTNFCKQIPNQKSPCDTCRFKNRCPKRSRLFGRFF